MPTQVTESYVADLSGRLLFSLLTQEIFSAHVSRDVLDKHFHIFAKIHIIIFVTSFSPCISKCKNTYKKRFRLGNMTVCAKHLLQARTEDTLALPVSRCNSSEVDRLLSCGLRHRAVWWIVTNISEYPTFCIFYTTIFDEPVCSTFCSKNGDRKLMVIVHRYVHSIAQQRTLIKFWPIRQLKSHIICQLYLWFKLHSNDCRNQI
jgi:hypothetical protein